MQQSPEIDAVKLHDGRYRLTTADRYEASGSSIRAQYAYGYDLADNLTAKTEPFRDDFEDGDYTGWSLGTGWSASTKVLKETNAASTGVYRALGKGDVDLRFRYMTTDTTAGLFGEMCFRTSSNNALTNNTVLRMSTDGMKLQKVVAGVVTVLDSETSATATANTWYRVRILAKGSNVTVWRGEGDDGPMEQVLSTTSAPTMTPASMRFISGANAAFAYDDVEIVADGWTSDTTFAVNSGNELTSSTFGGVTTTYGYDAWGNMTSKARGSYTASYAWHYGGKLTGVTSDFPSEGTVVYAYGGDGKRRERTAGGVTRSYWWTGGYQASSEQIGSDTSTRRTYIGGLGHFDTATASDSTYRYYGADHLGSTRKLWEFDRDLAGAYEYGPYGTAYADFGPGTTHRYTGHDWDAALCAYYAPFRYYSPGNARWLSRDPLGMDDGPNVYAYVSANPINARDPLGLTTSYSEQSKILLQTPDAVVFSVVAQRVSFDAGVYGRCMDWCVLDNAISEDSALYGVAMSEGGILMADRFNRKVEQKIAAQAAGRSVLKITVRAGLRFINATLFVAETPRLLACQNTCWKEASQTTNTYFRVTCLKDVPDAQQPFFECHRLLRKHRKDVE